MNSGKINKENRWQGFAKRVGWVDVEFSAGFNEAVGDGAGRAGVGAAEEEDVLFPDGIYLRQAEGGSRVLM